MFGIRPQASGVNRPPDIENRRRVQIISKAASCSERKPEKEKNHTLIVHLIVAWEGEILEFLCAMIDMVTTGQ